MIKECTIDNLEELNLLLENFEVQINYEEFTSHPFTKYLGYFKDQLLVAFLSYSVIYERIELNYILVLENYRQQNIASELMEKFLNICNILHATNITLEVCETNEKAICLYQKYGFCVVARRKKYYHGKDGLLMEKVIG